MSKKYIFLEGIPCSGKSFLLSEARKKGYKCIPEIALDIKELKRHHNTNNQNIFMENEDIKFGLANDDSDIVFIDRSPLSVLAYNICKNSFDSNYDYSEVLYWYFKKYYLNFKNNENFIVVYLNNKDYKKRTKFKNDPYANKKNLAHLDGIYKKILPLLVKKLLVMEDKYESNRLEKIFEFIKDNN